VKEPRLRPATLDDAALAADLMTASYPIFPRDPVITRYFWERPRTGWATGRFIAEIDERPAAYVDWTHAPREQDEDRQCHVNVALDRAFTEIELLTFLWQWVTDRAAAGGSRVLEAYAVEDEIESLEALTRIGYHRDRYEKVWELDLEAHGSRLVAEAGAARARVASDGYELTTAAGWHAADKFERLHALFSVTEQDIPTTFPIIPETFEDFMQRFSAPDRPHDRLWIAIRGDDPAALSYLRFPPVRGCVWTGYTCCHPDHRGRGVARAVKLQTLAQAVELGVPAVFTDNDSENAPMLHINEGLGYTRRPGFVSLVKRVET
jgi:RimJ/RimL family protein N-acetyltransferase